MKSKVFCFAAVSCHQYASNKLKILIAFLSMLLLISQCHAQENWLRSAGGSNLDEAMDVARTSLEDHLFVTGYFSGTCNFNVQNVSSSGLSDVFLAKYDDAGIPQWAKRFGGNNTDRGLAVASDNAGNSYVCGFYSGQATFGSYTLNAIDSGDVFVMKINPLGDVLWAKSAGGASNDLATGIAVDQNNNVVITGLFRGIANFGATTLTSTNYESSTNPSGDIFTAKLSSDGNWTWAKKAIAAGDERPTDVCCDAQNNIFICGQFSNDITFDLTHINTIINAGYLLKYNSSGQEQWFSKMSATQILPNALRTDSQNNVLVTGESIGQIILFGTNTEIVATTNSYSIFISKYGPTGNILWAKEDGSESFVSAKCIDIGPQNEAYVGGVFECTFSEYANALSDGLFNSSGYRDIFIARYESSGERTWFRQYGGPKEDNIGGIASGAQTDEPVVVGSFEKYFHAPGSELSFATNTTNFTPGVNDNLDDPNTSESLCGYGDYGSYIHLKAYNNKDIYIGRPVNTALPHFDYYTRGDCNLPVVEPCINDSPVPLVCNDELTVCGSASLYFVSNSGSNCWIGPEYEWQWDSGSSAVNQSVSATGWYSIEVDRADGCYSYADSIYVEILPVPTPLITDDEGVNLLSPPDAMNILLCDPDDVLLSGSDIDNLDGWWTNSDGTEFDNSDLLVNESGVYTYHIIGSNDCEEQNSVIVEIIDPLDEIDPLLEFNVSNIPINDTLIICGNDYITVELIDLLEQDEFAIYSDALWQIEVDTGYYPEYLGFESYSFTAQLEGWHYIHATPFIFSPEPCPADTIWYPEQTLEVFIVLLEDPNPQPQMSGISNYCPGDTILLTASGALSYNWSGPSIINYLSADSVLVAGPGTYIVSSTEIFDNGCSSIGVDGISIQQYPQPTIYSLPENPLLCPGDSVQLICEDAENYQWLGPQGQDLGNSQSIWVSQSGNYFCTAESSGCTQESNQINVEQYATPYLIALPSPDLCTTGSVTILVQTNPSASIEWQPPLSGSSSSLNVFDPGTYSVTVTFCDIETISSIEITLNQPEAIIIPSSDILCPGENIVLTANPGMEDYTWSPGGQHTESIIVTQGGNYTVEIENASGCADESNDFIIEVYDILPPTSNDINVCAGETATLSASGIGLFWSDDIIGQNILQTGSFFTTETINNSISYFVFSQDENCTSLANEVNVGVYPSSTQYINSLDSNYCAGASFELSAQATSGQGIQFHWTLPSGDMLNTPTVSINNATPADNGWYTFYSSDIHCSSDIDSIFITVENPFNFAIINETEVRVCVGSGLIVQTDMTSDSYEWNTPLGLFTDQTIVIDEVDFSAEGLYTLLIPGIYCETNSDTVHVDIVEYPEISLTDSTVYCSGGYMMAHLPAGYDIYLWSNGDTDNNAIMPTDGFISVEVTNLPACSVRDSISVNNIDCIDEFPNIFTPDGDGNNESVDFGWLRIPIEEVNIYNRWGNLIKHITASPYIWNGTNIENIRVSEGVYYYVVTSSLPGKQFSNLSGYIHVIFDSNAKKN